MSEYTIGLAHRNGIVVYKDGTPMKNEEIISQLEITEKEREQIQQEIDQEISWALMGEYL